MHTINDDDEPVLRQMMKDLLLFFAVAIFMACVVFGFIKEAFSRIVGDYFVADCDYFANDGTFVVINRYKHSTALRGINTLEEATIIANELNKAH